MPGGCRDNDRSAAERPARPLHDPPADQEFSAETRARVSDLGPGLSPRQHGEDDRHVVALSEVAGLLPPVLVHRDTMKIIDGAHRWRVAVAMGQEDIAVRYFDGDEDEAFLLAVALNLQHGLPLTLEDRKAAAARLLDAHPDWSDRRVADAAGLSPKTVAATRATLARSAEEFPQLKSRVGRDNRRRRLPEPGGVHAPEDGLHVAPRPGTAPSAETSPSPNEPRLRVERRTRARAPEVKPSSGPSGVDVAASMAALRDDPSIRLSDPGRDLLRLLAGSDLSDERWSRIVDAVPTYRMRLVADLAEQRAHRWQSLAHALRTRTLSVDDASSAAWKTQ